MQSGRARRGDVLEAEQVQLSKTKVTALGKGWQAWVPREAMGGAKVWLAGS